MRLYHPARRFNGQHRNGIGRPKPRATTPNAVTDGDENVERQQLEHLLLAIGELEYRSNPNPPYITGNL